MGLFSKKEHPVDPVPTNQAPPAHYNDAPHGHHTTRHSTDASPPRRKGFLSRRRSSSISSSDEEARGMRGQRHSQDQHRSGGGLLGGRKHSPPQDHHQQTSGGMGGLFVRSAPAPSSVDSANQRNSIAIKTLKIPASPPHASVSSRRSRRGVTPSAP